MLSDELAALRGVIASESDSFPVPPRAPRVLIVNDQEWWLRSLASVFEPLDLTVLQASSATEALQQTREAHPDLVIVHSRLQEESGVELCAKLRQQGMVDDATPILLTTWGACTRAQRLEALRAGAWDCLRLPTDAHDLLLRVQVYLRARFLTEQYRQQALVDPETDLYNMRGILRQARQFGHASARSGSPFGCVLIALVDGAPEEGAGRSSLPVRFARFLRSSCRGSDVVGRVGPLEYLVLAPQTTPERMMHMVNRLLTAGRAVLAAESADAPRIVVGCAVASPDAGPAEGLEVLGRAAAALRRASVNGTYLHFAEEPAPGLEAGLPEADMGSAE